MPNHADYTNVADLHAPVVFSESDPGAIGAGKGWFKRSTRELKLRNAANSGWDLVTATDVTSYTDEQAQDAVGGMVDASLTYVDGIPLLQRAALTGDVTASAGSNATTIANSAVTLAKIQDISTARILGRDTAGSGVVEQLTAAEVLALLGGSPAPGAGLPYMYPFGDAIDDPINDNFREGDGAGGMDTSGTRFSGASAWTAENIGASTVAVADGRLWLTSPASASIQIRGYYQAVPSGNWCIRMNVGFRQMITDASEKAVGMYLRDSTTGKIEWWAIGYSGGAGVLWANKMTNATTHSAVRATSGLGSTLFWTFLEIEYDGTSYHFRAGHAEQPLQRLTSAYTFAKTDFLGAAADGIGVFSENDQSVANTLITRGFYRVPVSSVMN